MPKVKFNTSWINNYPEFTWDENELFCRVCSKIVHAEKKFIVDQHVKTTKHLLNKRKSEGGSSTQQTLANCLKESSKTNDQKEFNQDLCRALIASNIPIDKLNNPNLNSFLSKYCKFNIPDESTLRKGYIDAIYKQTIDQIKDLVSDNCFYIVVDETTDSRGRYIAHALIGVLDGKTPGKTYLFASKELEKANNLTITRFVQESLTNFFLPEAVPSEKFILFLSDAAPYMVKAGTNLKIFYSNMLHTTCLAHGLNRVAECVREQFTLVNDLINYTKKVFLKAPTRIQFYKEKFPNLPLPPQPVITRWGTWLDAALFYAENFESIREVIQELTDSSCTALTKSKELFRNSLLNKHLVFIKANYSFIPTSILQLENTSLTLSETVNLVHQFQLGCESVEGEIGATVLKKFNSVVKGNHGFELLRNVSKVFSGQFDDVDSLTLDIDLINKLKYAPITSVDVERTFSVFKNMFTDKRHKFLLENFEKHLIVNCFNSSKE